MINYAQCLTISPALAEISHLADLLDRPVSYWSPVARVFQRELPADSVVLAWGNKPSAHQAARFAERIQRPIIRLEDGFLRSLLLGHQSPPFSIVIDDLGIYYDAAQPSRLERLISQPLTLDQRQRAQALQQQWQQLRLSKYNHSVEQSLPQLSDKFVLVVDQTKGDASVRDGLADGECFQTMLATALQAYPDHQVVIKTHPDVLAGKKQGYLTGSAVAELSAEETKRIVLLADDIHPPKLLEAAQAVFCVTSQMGFEALLWGKTVHTFGMPFYAGWGLTVDHLAAPERRAPVTIEQLVYAALIAYPRYWHPEWQTACQVEELMAWLALQRQQMQRIGGEIIAVDVSRWKQPIVQQFLRGARLHFVYQDKKRIPLLEKKYAPSMSPAPCLRWGNSQPAELRVEDGFIRSVGLGADLTRPLSWVIDELGIYYDATRPSALERLLVEGQFSGQDLQRAERLIERLVTLKVSKYNVGAHHWQRPQQQRVILVPGQVESDASIRYGSPILKTNLALLQAVRNANPNAYIVYKPHPDVQAGLRLQGQGEQTAAQFADEVIGNIDMAYLLDHIDEVHTLTSLTGFEALLRRIPVTCYGQPFYAGWGLTDDIYPHDRRGIARSLPELVAATLIYYPFYVSPSSGYYLTPEQTIDWMHQQRQNTVEQRSLSQWLFRQWLKLRRS
ncbi:capsular polysaccharide biosynthesis protein [Vibrio metschnikovii]|uniref:capsular polysaccharide biosynthesis protein n=1 Tax=Vibrio metschnikovii TaxID=28172 RepID=UPI0013026A2A|nr:capsular polysaccharide biosynthesis protein [Vibrio metschnikovii]